MNFYIYMLIDPRSSLPFYVGKGKGKRAWSHLKETKESTINRRKFNKIQSIIKAGFEPIVVICKRHLTEEDAYEIETKVINFFGRKGYDKHGILTNICKDANPHGSRNFITNNPGSSLKGKTYDDIYGAEKSDEIRRKRSKALSGRKFTPETLEKMRASALKKMENGFTMPSQKGKTFSY